MAKYSNKNILDSGVRYLCFSSSSIMKPRTIHGDQDTTPMQNMSELASVLYHHDKKLPTVLAGQFAKAKLVHQESKIFPFIMIQLDDGRIVSPFIVRRHELDPIDRVLILQSVYALFRFIVRQEMVDYTPEIALERPVDADERYDRMIALLPNNVTVYKETRDEENKP